MILVKPLFAQSFDSYCGLAAMVIIVLLALILVVELIGYLRYRKLDREFRQKASGPPPEDDPGGQLGLMVFDNSLAVDPNDVAAISFGNAYHGVGVLGSSPATIILYDGSVLMASGKAARNLLAEMNLPVGPDQSSDEGGAQ